MKPQPYPRYNPSGVEWLGQVPEHWEVKRLKFAAQRRDKKIEADGENPLPYVGLENIESWTGQLLPIDPGVVPSGTANAFNAEHTLFGKLRPYLAKACNPRFEGLCSTELLVLEGVGLDRGSLLYSLLSDGFIQLVNSSTYGSKMPRANWDFISSCVLPIAPRPEQEAIARFLDRQTERVDLLVAKKRQLIERMKEKRIALISLIATRGLSPGAAAGLPEDPTRNIHGHNQLDGVPVHWTRTRLKRVVWVRGRIGFRGYTTDDLVNEGEGALVLGGANLTDVGRLDLSKLTYLSWFKYEESPEIKISVNDLIIGQRGTCGNVVVIDRDIGPATINPSLVLLKCPVIDSKFLNYWLMGQPIQSIFDSYLSATAVPMLSQQQIGNIPVCHPQLPEQIEIASYLDGETAKLDSLVVKVEEAIERLQEYRTALITAAVTGKIDVRKEAHR